MHYPALSDRFWALTQMQRAHQRLTDVPGLEFYRLMGSGGGNGFSLRPNWKVYAWLGQWSDEGAADRFFAENDWFAEVREHTDHRITFRMQPTMAHGEWGGTMPFLPDPRSYDAEGPVAVITRATIHPTKLPDFWRYVPRTSASVYDHPARLLSLGIGEYPVFMQATFSVWATGRAMTDYAYAGEHHQEVVRLTRQRGWYKEEMFARFRLLGIDGKWPDFDSGKLK
ncbi:hypothetical protein [Neolewinella xylanilytica]|uniref:hypothetical protein n=1 Tax=Neolewinella xylanilytica TaxID=1514080 RepID=UPI001FE79A03|nr:hypothetical protein [Neolewinella xylanilytica]